MARQSNLLSLFCKNNQDVAATGSSTSNTAFIEEVNMQATPIQLVVHAENNVVEPERNGESSALQGDVKANAENNKKKRKLTEWSLGREFQPDWARRFPFIEPVCEKNEFEMPKRPTKMRCVACSWKNRSECVFQLKLDTVEKHAGKVYEKMIVDGEEINISRWKTKEECRHMQAVEEYKKYLQKQDLPSIPLIKTMLQKMADRNLRSKVVQLQALFHVLKRGKPLSDFPQHENLLSLQPIPDFPTTHWSIQSGEEFAKCIDQVILDDLREEMHNCDYFAVSLDEASAKDNSSWLCMTVYMVKNFVRCAFYAGITCLQKNATGENIFAIVQDNLVTKLGLTSAEIGKKLVCIGLDGCSVMQGCRNGLTVRMQTSLAPYALGIHCMAHRMNLAYKIVDTFESVTKIEDLVSESFNFFCRSSKRVRQFKKYAAGLTKGSKMLKNVNTRWISLYKPAKRLFQEYQSMVGLMDKLSSGKRKDGKDKAQNLLSRLVDLETLLTLAGILPMLREMNFLIKLAQKRTMYIPEYVTARKLACDALDCLYPTSPNEPYDKEKFVAWNNLVNIEAEKSASILEYDSKGVLCMKVHSHLVQMYTKKARVQGRLVRHAPITSASFSEILEKVRTNLAKIAATLSKEIKERFPRDELLDAMAIVYPQFWISQKDLSTCQKEYKSKLHVLISHFAKTVSVGADVVVHGAINEGSLLEQSECFGQTMWSQCQSLEEPKEFGSITRLWLWLGNSQVLQDHMPEFFKLVRLCQTMVLGSVEDERIFSIMGYLKNKVRNRLEKNLDLCLRAYTCNYTVADFPYDRALALWASTSRRERPQPNEVAQLAQSNVAKTGSSGWSAAI